MDRVWVVAEIECDIDYCGEIERIKAFNSEDLAHDYIKSIPNWRLKRVQVRGVDVETNGDSFLPTWSVEDRTALGRGLTVTRVQHYDHEVGEVWEIDDYRTRERWPAVIVRANEEWDAIEKASTSIAQFKAEKEGIA